MGSRPDEVVAFIDTSGTVVTTPMAFGPTRRMPWMRADRTSSCSAARPSSPTSANPPDTTTTARTPLWPQASTTPGTSGAGTVTMARSMAPGTSPMVGYAGTPATEAASGFTGKTGPVNSRRSRFRRISWPIEPGLREAPMTAIDRGRSSGVIDWTEARRSRSAMASRASGVVAIGNRRWTRPSSNRRSATNPASRNTPSMLRFSANVSATK